MDNSRPLTLPNTTLILWREIEAAKKRYPGMTMERVRKFPATKALRGAYKTLGKHILDTLVEVAGGKPSVGFDGTSFAAVLCGESEEHREFRWHVLERLFHYVKILI